MKITFKNNKTKEEPFTITQYNINIPKEKINKENNKKEIKIDLNGINELEILIDNFAKILTKKTKTNLKDKKDLINIIKKMEEKDIKTEKLVEMINQLIIKKSQKKIISSNKKIKQ